MKKKIAVFSSGWIYQILGPFLEGMGKFLNGKQIDTYLFLCYPGWSYSDSERQGEYNIFRLPHLEDFDCAIIFSNSFEFKSEKTHITNKCKKAGIPTVSIGIKTNGLYSVCIDNTSGMRELCEHLVKKHNIKRPMYIAGSKDNADSTIRLKVISEVMQENNIPFSEKDVFYTYWKNTKSLEYVDKLCKSGVQLPDAIICANDGIALNTCIALQNNGIKVPKDVIVTGFDNIYDGQIFDPALSSIDQNYEIAGLETARLICDVINGVPREKDITIPCRFIPRESCCGGKIANAEELRRNLGRSIYLDKYYDTRQERKLTQIEKLILMSNSYKELRNNMITLFGTEFANERESLHILLEPNFELSIHNSSVPLPTRGYSKHMQVAFSMEKGIIYPTEVINSKDLIPARIDDNLEHLYAFLPLHENNTVFGYVILSDCLPRLDGHELPKFQQRLNIALERYRQKFHLDELNKQLTEIIHIDALTRVKNRIAYETKADELTVRIKSGKEIQFAIAMFDTNNLKKVNDVLGHNAGDAYLINSCRLICNTFKHSSIYRIGGDEFLAILINEDFANRKKLIAAATKKMAQLQTANIPETEKVSFACGIAEYDPSADTCVQDVFNRADFLMYKNKAATKIKQKTARN